MKGETIGIIGGTGSGKTSLINLIPRFYDVRQGEVLVDGVDVKEYPFSQLRGMIGIVPQKAVLFKGTIRHNMQWRDKTPRTRISGTLLISLRRKILLRKA